MKCLKCGCTLFDVDVRIDKLDGRELGREVFHRCYCRSCGATHVKSEGRILLAVDFSWEQLAATPKVGQLEGGTCE